MAEGAGDEARLHVAVILANFQMLHVHKQACMCISNRLHVQAGGPGFDPQQLPWFLFSSSWLTNVDEMKGL